MKDLKKIIFVQNMAKLLEVIFFILIQDFIKMVRCPKYIVKGNSPSTLHTKRVTIMLLNF